MAASAWGLRATCPASWPSGTPRTPAGRASSSPQANGGHSSTACTAAGLACTEPRPGGDRRSLAMGRWLRLLAIGLTGDRAAAALTGDRSLGGDAQPEAQRIA